MRDNDDNDDDRGDAAPSRRAFIAMAAFAGPAIVPFAAAAAEPCSGAAPSASALLDSYVAIVNGHDPSRMAEVCAENYIQHSGRSGPGLAAQIENYRTIFERWPDISMNVDDRIFGDDKLVARNTFSATHSRTVLGVEPTGRKVSFRTIDIWRVADGKFAEHWDIVDVAGLEKQLRGT
jgi:predicted ester cyclase